MNRKITMFFISAIVLMLNTPLFAKPTSPPPAQFNASTYSGCAPLTVTFYNSSIGNGTYNWNFGDPASGVLNTSTVCSPTHTFIAAGTYTVTLNYYWNATTYTTTATITVYPLPNPTIGGKDTVCAGSTVIYTATGAGGSQFYWTITGGSIVGPNNTNTVAVLWSTPGIGVLTVKETTLQGCSNTKTKKVLVANQPVIGNFCQYGRGGSNGGVDPKKEKNCLCERNINVLTAIDQLSQIFSPSLYNFQWTVTGGGSYIVSGGTSNTMSMWVGSGPTVTVELVVYNSFGCSDTQKCIFDICPSPKALFKADTACLGGTTHFNASGSMTLANITNFTWNFGDNTQGTSTSPLINHKYNLPGVYPVTLSVTYASGCSHDTTFNVLVNPGTAPPIECPGTVCHHTKHCYATPYFAGATYAWTITGGVGTPNATGDSICVVWGNGPLGNITLNVTGGPYTCGYNSIDVPVFPVKIKITGPDTVCSNSTVQFQVPLIPGSCYSWMPSSPNITVATNAGNMVNVYIPNVVGTYQIVADVTNEITCCQSKDTFKFVVQGKIQIDTIQSTCEYSTKTYTSNVPVTWQVSGGSIQSSTSTSVTINWGSAGIGVIHAYATQPDLVCENFVMAQIQLVPLPPNPPINGPTLVCKGTTATYNYINMPAIASSNWSISPGIAHSPSGNTDVITFNTPGTYTITVDYFNSNFNASGPYSCKSSSQLQVLVVDTARPTIGPPGSKCIGSTQVYTMSSNPGNIWQWAVIGGQVLAQTSTTITVQWGNINSGQVNIQNSLCTGFRSLQVPIIGFPAGIITKGDSTCKGDSIRLYAPPGFTYLWNTGATTQSINVTSAGTYSVAISNGICTTTLVINLAQIPKKPKPNVNINWSCMASPTLPVPYSMQATYNPTWSYQWSPQTSIPASADTSYQHYSNVFNSTHTVIVTNQFGCKDTASVTLNQSCTVTGGGGSGCVCKPTIAVNYDPCFGQFTLTVSGAPYSLVYWDFSDGDYSNLHNPQHWFSDTGYFSVNIGIYCTSGCWYTQSVKIYVPYILRPKVSHSFPTACNYNLINFFYKPTSVVKAPTVSRYTDWGDASSPYTGNLPQTHTYSTPGTYIITHQVSVPGCTKTVYDTVTILPFAAAFSFCNGCTGQSMQFTDQSTSAYPITQWSWNFGDATTSNLQNPFHIYNAPGTYTVTLTITNQQGCVSVYTTTVTITTFNGGPLTFNLNGSAVTGSTFTFCEGGYLIATAPLVGGYTYAWNNGVWTNKDTITKSGVYWVIVGNGNGCTDKLGPFTVIVNPNPNATILMPDSLCASYQLDLNALNGLGYTFGWNLNNGAYTTTGNPGSIAVPAGVYNTVLTVTNNFGCTANDTAVITWLAGPVVTVSPSYIAFCQGGSTPLTATITGPYTSLQWSTGSNLNPITVYTGGQYTATATDAFGCTGIGYSFVVVNPKPNLSNVPKGCYKVCNANIGFKVCGPYPLPGESLSYNWLLNGVTVSTNQNISINAAGNYQLICQNNATGCADTSEIFNVQFVPGPVGQIISTSPNPTICKGSNGCITIAVDHPVDDIYYTWYYNENPDLTEEPIGHGDSIVICDPGVYILEAFMSNCCKAYDTIVITEGDCCFNPQDTSFHLIQDSTVYTTNTWWDGKYYVAGRVYVRNKAVLDMSTIDVVFDSDGEIIFEDSSTVRANNSVFRPCDMHDVWVGFTFRDSSSGFIHTSLFKNAKHAIDVFTSGTEGVKITDNTFTDCNIGVRINRATKNYNQGITSNSFVISDYDFTTSGLYPSFDFFGIQLISVKMDEIVSQNNFRNSDKSGQFNKYYGIYMLRSLANLSENVFSNMHRSIDVTSNIGLVNIENNLIEKTFQGKFSSDVQIRVTNTQMPVLIFANSLRNSDNKYAKTVGIFSESSNGINIRDNNIKGFDVGIWTRRTNGAVVNENDIDLAGDIGILDSLSTKMDINCNIIRMKDCKSVLNTGCNSVGIYMQQGNASNNIFTNCIFDTRRAIIVQKFGVSGPIPNIINNYMYNYIYAGIASYNHTGTVGGSPQPGRNTFTSNNRGGGALDITSATTPITYWCNFGILATNGLVTPSGGCPANQMYSSTAACGNQIVNTKYYRQDKWDVCDNYTGKSVIIIVDHDGGIGIDFGKLGTIQVAQIPPQERIAVAQQLITTKDKLNFDIWMNRMLTEKGMTAFDMEVLIAEWTYQNEDKFLGIDKLTSVLTNSTQEAEAKAILLAQWQSNASGIPKKSALSEMNAIDVAGSENAAVARDVIHASLGSHDYKFGRYYVEPAPALNADISQPYMRLVPNPASDLVRVEFRIAGEGDALAEMYDLTGNKIDIVAMKLGEGAYQFNLKGISSGIYLVSLLDVENNTRQVTKLVVE